MATAIEAVSIHEALSDATIHAGDLKPVRTPDLMAGLLHKGTVKSIFERRYGVTIGNVISARNRIPEIKQGDIVLGTILQGRVTKGVERALGIALRVAKRQKRDVRQQDVMYGIAKVYDDDIRLVFEELGIDRKVVLYSQRVPRKLRRR